MSSNRSNPTRTSSSSNAVEALDPMANQHRPAAAQFCIKRFRAPFHQHPNFNQQHFLDTIHTHRFCCFTCNTQIFAAYSLILFSFVWIALGAYLAFIKWDLLFLTLSAGGWILFFFGICLFYCGRMTSKKEVQTIRDFYQAHYDDNLRSTVSARHNYQDDLGNHFNHRVCSADFQPNLHRMQRQDSRQPENGTTLALPATVNDREVSARSSQTRPSDQVVILENMYSTTLHRSQLSINMLPQYSETCEPLLVETNDLPSESNLSPAVQIDPMEPRVETTQIIAAAIPFELTVATSESTTNDQISPLIDTASPFIDSTRSTSNEQIYENRDAISSQRHCAANTDTDHLPSYEPIISSNHNLLPTEQHLQHLMIENDPNDSPNHTEDETTNLLSITEQPCDEQRDSVTACSLAEAFNRALRHQNGEESLLLMPVASQSQSHQPGVQIKVNELIQTCPEISNGFEQSELLLVGTNQTLSAVDRSSFDRDTVRRSIRRQYLYVNQDILKARSNSHRTRRRQLNSDNAILDEVRPLSAPLARSPPDAQPNRNSSTERSSATYLGSLLQNLFDSDQATHSNNSNTFEPECSNNDEQQIALISSSDSLASAGNISSVSGETTFSATSSFENFQHTATSTDRDRSTAEPIEPANLSQQPVDQATADDLSTLDKQTEQVNINQREVKGDEFSNATTLPRRFLVVDSLDQLTSTISNLSLIESDVIVDPMQNGAVDDEETNEHEECEEDEGGDNTLNSISAENQLNVQNRSIRTSRTGHEVIFGGSRRRHKSPSTRQSRKALRKRYKKFLLVFLTPF